MRKMCHICPPRCVCVTRFLLLNKAEEDHQIINMSSIFLISLYRISKSQKTKLDTDLEKTKESKLLARLTSADYDETTEIHMPDLLFLSIYLTIS
jgi:hypothetical protein